MYTSVTSPHHVLLATTSSGSGGSFLPFLVLAGVFFFAYMVFLRPARSRQRAAAQTRREVSVGDEVTTTAGLIATVVEVTDDMLTLEVAPGVRCRYVPAAILRVNGDDEPETVADPDADSTPDRSTHEVIEQPTVADSTPDTADDPDKPDETASA